MSHDALQYIVQLISVVGGFSTVALRIMQFKKLSVQIGCIFSLTVSLIVILGYVFNVPEIYTIPYNKTAMAFPTAVLFFIISGCVFITATEIKFNGRNDKH